MSKELPKWVWDLIIGLQVQEEVHPKLYQQKPGGKGNGYIYEPAEWCAGRALDHVPTWALAVAEGIRTYLSQDNQDKQEGNGDE